MNYQCYNPLILAITSLFSHIRFNASDKLFIFKRKFFKRNATSKFLHVLCQIKLRTTENLIIQLNVNVTIIKIQGGF